MPIDLKEANEFVANFHRHNKPVVGARFSIGASIGDQLVGVVIVGRPVARMLQDGFTAEVTRLCTREEAPRGACSFLYQRAWRAWQQMGGRRMVTYTLASEPGSSLKGAGWKLVGETEASDGWVKSRPGRAWQTVYGQKKFRWEAA